MAETKIVVGPQPFSVGEEYPWLAERDEDGAVVTFTGKVRNHNLGDSVKALTLEHYPGMTEKALAEIVDEARNRWPLGRVTVIHRIGELWPGDEIVFVGVTSAHRSSAFEAGQFIMDYLKTRAPFWKREATPEGDRWVEARESDRQAAKRWCRSLASPASGASALVAATEVTVRACTATDTAPTRRAILAPSSRPRYI